MSRMHRVLRCVRLVKRSCGNTWLERTLLRFRRPALLLFLLPIVAACTGSTGTRTSARSCPVSLSDLSDAGEVAPTMTEGSITDRSDERFGLIARDGSATLVALCIPRAGALQLPETDPVLVSDARRTESFGGSLISSPTGAYHVSYFPPTFETRLTITQAQSTLASVMFPPSNPSRCRLKARAPFTVTRCGVLIGLQWETGLPIRASKVAGMDVGVTTEDPSGKRALGFFYEEASDGSSGLVVHFSTRRPETSGARVKVTLRSVDLHEKAGEPDRSLDSFDSPRYTLQLTCRADPPKTGPRTKCDSPSS